MGFKDPTSVIFDGDKDPRSRIHDSASPRFDALVVANMRNINALAREAHVATMWGAREYARAGGFISYGPNEADMFRGWPLITSTKFLRAPSQATSRLRSRPKSTWPSISRPQRSLALTSETLRCRLLAQSRHKTASAVRLLWGGKRTSLARYEHFRF